MALNSKPARGNAAPSLLWRGAPGSWGGLQLAMSWSRVGSAPSANSLASPPQRPAYARLNFGASLERGGTRWRLNLLNATNTRAKLGDLGHLGYMRFERDGATPGPMVATLPGRQWRLDLQQRF